MTDLTIYSSDDIRKIISLKFGSVYIYKHPSRRHPPYEVSIKGQNKVSGCFYEKENAIEYATFLNNR